MMPENEQVPGLRDWNDLRTFLAIADGGSLAAAARALSVNHSTIFRRLNEMEAGLGVRLFERFPTGYQLTPAGARMLEHARSADAAIQRLSLELAGQDLAPAGTVRITTAANIAYTLLPPVVKELRDTHPGILVEISTGDSDYDLNRREADLALRATTRPPEHLVGRKVMELDWWLCGDPTAQAVQSLEDCKGLPVIGADRAMMRLQAFQWLEGQMGQQVVARANDLSTMAALILAGIGIGLLPSDQQEKGLHRLYRVPDLSGELWLLTHPDLRNTRRVQVVWDAVLKALQQIPSGP